MRYSNFGIGCVMVALLTASLAKPAAAGWLPDVLLRPTPADQDPTRNSEAALATALRHAREMNLAEGGAALAATVSQEGHWTFVNAAGERFTAATPDEMKRVTQVLSPDVKPPAGPAVVLAEDAAFRTPDAALQLPATTLHLAIASSSKPLRLVRHAADRKLAVRILPKVSIALDRRDAVDETIWQLQRRLPIRRARVISLDADRQLDRIDAAELANGLAGSRGQMVIVTGRIDADRLYFQTTGGIDRSIMLRELTQAADAADVALIVLGSANGRQPGARNWLWQKAEVGRFGAAQAAETLGEFLNALADEDGLVVRANSLHGGRVVITASGFPSKSPGLLPRSFGELTGTVTGRIAITGIEMHLVSSVRQRELGRRLVHWLPSWATWGYVASLLLGILGSAASWGWWTKLWPPETPADYPSTTGFHAARAVRSLIYALAFMPLTAVAAVPVAVVGLITRRPTRPDPSAGPTSHHAPAPPSP